MICPSVCSFGMPITCGFLSRVVEPACQWMQHFVTGYISKHGLKCTMCGYCFRSDLKVLCNLGARLRLACLLLQHCSCVSEELGNVTWTMLHGLCCLTPGMHPRALVTAGTAATSAVQSISTHFRPTTRPRHRRHAVHRILLESLCDSPLHAMRRESRRVRSPSRGTQALLLMEHHARQA
jgi:hypothetical protein